MMRQREKRDGLAVPEFGTMLATKCSWKIKGVEGVKNVSGFW